MLNSDNFDEIGRSCKLMKVTLNENTESRASKSRNLFSQSLKTL